MSLSQQRTFPLRMCCPYTSRQCFPQGIFRCCPYPSRESFPRGKTRVVPFYFFCRIFNMAHTWPPVSFQGLSAELTTLRPWVLRGGGGGREWLQPEIIVVLTHMFLSQAAFLTHQVFPVECCILCVSVVHWIGSLLIDSLQKSTKRRFDRRDGIWWQAELHASKVFSALGAICYDSLFLLFVFWYSTTRRRSLF